MRSPRSTRISTIVGTVTLAAACGASPTPSPVRSSAPPPIASAPGPTLPPGVLFVESGTRGEVRVEDRDGLRWLTVGGEIMGATPVDRLSEAPRGDALVELVGQASPGGRVLLLGLGTGRTATELAASGAQITTVEVDEAVVRAARAAFAYVGDVEIAAAESYLAKSAKAGPPFDVVLVDTLGVEGSRDAPTIDAAVAFLRARSDAGGGERAKGPLLALRFWGTPNGPRAAAISSALRKSARYVQLFGSGVANEPQVVYALAGAARQNLVAPSVQPLMAWPIPADDLALAARAAPSGADVTSDAHAWLARSSFGPSVERQVTLAGYLVRTKGGALCLDLPHYEMGAIRYRLQGADAPDLEALLPKSAIFPTSGDIGADGDTAATLREVLDGGGFKRNETRFSSVAVVLRGRARLVAVVDPDASASVPGALRDGEPDHPALHYGGSLYDLEIDQVVGTLDFANWKKALPGVKDALPLAAIEKGDLERARAAEPDALGRLDAALGPLAPFAAERRSAAKLLSAIARQASPPATDDASRAAACDRAHGEGAADPFHSGPITKAIDRALFTCATRHYERALGPRPAAGSTAARRLLALYRARGFDEPAFEKKADALQARVPGLEELDEPPPR